MEDDVKKSSEPEPGKEAREENSRLGKEILGKRKYDFLLDREWEVVIEDVMKVREEDERGKIKFEGQQFFLLLNTGLF